VPDPLDRLADLVAAGGVVVLSGAGLSTESGIPDYRGPTGRTRAASPMTFTEFVGSDAARRRYWARSHLGWRHIAAAAANRGHLAVADLERDGLLAGTITQNVDGLHQAAGSRRVVDLHGRLDRVICRGCGAVSPRGQLDARLREANLDWSPHLDAITPDGDAVVDAGAVEQFRVVDCDLCGGVLKPDVVFFGENVPPPRVAECYALVEQASSMLVLGSSLTVMSGYRFVRHAAKHAVPVAIVNQGATRGDPLADLTIDAPLGAVLETLVSRTRRGRVGTQGDEGNAAWTPPSTRLPPTSSGSRPWSPTSALTGSRSTSS
jgi:NAD-dependent SIR2 family protein deacetylase